MIKCELMQFRGPVQNDLSIAYNSLCLKGSHILCQSSLPAPLEEIAHLLLPQRSNGWHFNFLLRLSIGPLVLTWLEVACDLIGLHLRLLVSRLGFLLGRWRVA